MEPVSEAEKKVPLEIWNTRHFQEWYSSLRSSKHELIDVLNVEWTFRVGPMQFPLFFALHVAIKVAGENRIKSNEVVIIRPNISSTCVFSRGTKASEDRFVLEVHPLIRPRIRSRLDSPNSRTRPVLS